MQRLRRESLVHFLGMEQTLNPINILCVGTTGMLSGMTQALVSRGNRVHVIARTSSSFDRCASGVSEEHRDRLVLHRCDYGHPEAWSRALDEIPDPIDAAVCWIHSSAPQAFKQVVQRFPRADILRVGSSSTSPTEAETWPYRTVILGSVREGEASRWLTHDEISEGVLDAFLSDDKVSVVGSIK